MTYLITFYGFAYVIISFILLIPIGCLDILLSFTPLKKTASFCMYKVVQGWARALIFLIACRPKLAGREHIIKKGGMCFVCNHSGIFDIVLLLAYAGRPFGFIAKKELAYIPFLNIWILILGGLFIDRKNPRKALKTINHGVKYIQKGGSMLIFPEGTRSQGRGLLPFKAGAFKLALKSAMPLVPVAITGSYDIFEKHHLVSRCPVSISFGKPIYAKEVQGEAGRQNISDYVYTAIDKMLKPV
ncbi:MAG: 1-acyl-sn-glycerol-3-phosphate acyltransferase [Spirochaetaceae bacterium]|jgi:1-acyl-sn-glycerol-3-phosphate acyltransferase|nr:1-acyl-sn-glycerol-3-phosphate acyltransferase [Spirochaetaceae bacterium]